MNEQTIAVLIPIGLLLWHLFGVGASYLSDMLKQSQPDNKWSRLIDIVNTAVNQVEQQYSQGVSQGGLNSANKKKEAIDTVELLCSKFGIQFNPDVADKLVEDACYALNVAQGKAGSVDAQPTTSIPAIRRASLGTNAVQPS